jgi:hypothetical protein
MKIKEQLIKYKPVGGMDFETLADLKHILKFACVEALCSG